MKQIPLYAFYLGSVLTIQPASVIEEGWYLECLHKVWYVKKMGDNHCYGVFETFPEAYNQALEI